MQRPDPTSFTSAVISSNRLGVRLSIECKVRVGIENDPVCTREIACPRGQTGEPIMNGNVRAVSSAVTGDAPYYVMGLDVATSGGNKARQQLSVDTQVGSRHAIPSEGCMV